MDDKKEKLQSAAHFLFLKNGYKKTNIAQIAKKAGLAVGSFYNYYPSKQAIFLEVYIAENEAVRNRLIQEINWERDIEQLIDQFFAYTVKNIMKNNILIEWNNDSVSKMLHDYYYSQTGKENNSFYRFLQETVSKRLQKEKIAPDLIGKVLKVFDFIYYIDCHVTGHEFEGYSETLQTFIHYFIKGITSFACKNE